MKFTKDQRDRLLLTGVCTLVLVGLGYQFLLSGAQEGLEKTRKDVAKAQKRFEDAEKFLKTEAPVHQAKLEEIRTRLAEVEAGMASTVDPFGWSDRLVRDFARGKNVEIQQVEKAGGETVELLPDFPYKAVTFKVNGVGTFWDFGAFLAEFENAFPIFQVREMKLTTSPAAGDAPRAVGGAGAKLSFQFSVVALAKPRVS